jgi:hypothetical protein
MALAVLTSVLGGVAAWERALLRGARSPCAIEILPSGAALAAFVVLANGETIAVRAVHGIGVARHWVALRSASITGRGVLLTAGMLEPAALRVLRLWALWGRIPGVASGQRAA